LTPTYKDFKKKSKLKGLAFARPFSILGNNDRPF